jgi:hypothetical protein
MIKNIIKLDDVKIFIDNVNLNIDKYNDDFTVRKRNINFKDVIYFLLKYNLIIDSSYNKVNVNLYNNNENNNVSSQAYINKRKKINIENLNNINIELIKSFYLHLNIYNNERLIAVDGTQLNFLYSLNDKFNVSSNNNYTYTYLSCLYDVNMKIPINYLVSNNDERTMLKNQLSYLNKNDILIADRGYYSYELVQTINKKNLKFIFRISKYNEFYINNKLLIESKNEDSISIIKDNVKYVLYWYTTRQYNNEILTNELKKINLSIKKITEEKKLIESKINSLEIKCDNLLKKNKKLICLIEKSNKKIEKLNDPNNKLNKEIKEKMKTKLSESRKIKTLIRNKKIKRTIKR